MLNIIKAMNYQTRHDIFTIIVALLTVIVVVASFVGGGDVALTDYTGCDAVLSVVSVFPIIFVLLPLFFTCKICGGDYGDKTINYEVMAGHTRGQMYMGRFVASLLWVGGLSAAAIVVPTACFTLMNGWGVYISFSEILIRFLLVFLLLVRMTAGFTALTFLVKNCYFAMFFGYVFTELILTIYIIFNEMDIEVPSIYSGFSCMNELLDLSNAKTRFIDGQDVAVFAGQLKSSLVYGTIVSSVLITAVFLLIGFLTFRKTDMK